MLSQGVVFFTWFNTILWKCNTLWKKLINVKMFCFSTFWGFQLKDKIFNCCNVQFLDFMYIRSEIFSGLYREVTEVAVKQLHPGEDGEPMSFKAKAEFQNESQILMTLHHPNLVNSYHDHWCIICSHFLISGFKFLNFWLT